MPTAKRTKRTAEAAVPVSYRLQFYSVVVAFTMVVFQSLYFLLAGGWQQFHGVNLQYLTPVFLSQTLFPVVLFLLAFFTSPRYQVGIGRWFIAVLKTALAVVVFGMLQTVWNFVTITLYSPWGYHGSMPPSWITSNAAMYVSMLVVLLGMLLVIKRTARK